jgi:hypothetical protein
MSNKHSLIQKTSVEFQRETEILRSGLNTLYIIYGRLQKLQPWVEDRNMASLGSRRRYLPFRIDSIIQMPKQIQILFSVFLNMSITVLPPVQRGQSFRFWDSKPSEQWFEFRAQCTLNSNFRRICQIVGEYFEGGGCVNCNRFFSKVANFAIFWKKSLP